MTTRRVLVTGASGFIGQPLVRALAHAGYKVRAVVRRPISFSNSIDVVTVPDFRGTINWNPILQDIDIVIHLAGLSHADQRDTAFDAHNKVNWIATLYLATAVQTAGIKHFVFISSVRAQVGASATSVVHEQDSAHPTDSYGRSKLEAEWAIQAAKIPFTILRPVVVYGPHPKGNFSTLVRLAKLPFPLPFKSFSNRRSVLGLDNLISAILFVMNNPAAIDETFLVADPEPYTLSELLSMLRKARGLTPRLVYIPKFVIWLALRLLGRSHLWQRINEDLVVDTTKLKSLGWSAPVETYDGIRTMLATENGKDFRGNEGGRSAN